MLQVATIDQHGILQLFGPAALVEAEFTELLFSQSYHVIDDLLVFLIIGNSDCGAGYWTKLGTLAAHFIDFNLGLRYIIMKLSYVWILDTFNCVIF